MQDWGLEIIFAGEDTLLEGESIRHELAGILLVQRYNRSLQHDYQADRLPLHVLLLQQPKVINLGKLCCSSSTRLLCDGDWLHLCYLLPAKFCAAGEQSSWLARCSLLVVYSIYVYHQHYPMLTSYHPRI